MNNKVSSSKIMAESLIGTKSVPAGLPAIINKSTEAHAYHNLNAYPLFSFGDWKTEDRGPLPKVLPLCRSVVQRGATWLFGKPVQIKVQGNEKLEQFLQKAWKSNRLDSRLVAMAKTAALDGSIALKFSYDNEDGGLCIQSLSIIDELRLFRDPHDINRILMARVQYPYVDPTDGQTYWFREEWTNTSHVEYVPLKATEINYVTSTFDPDTSQQWVETARNVNPFGEIPIHLIKNIESDDAFGHGDMWDLYRIFDRVCLTAHLMDRSNQFDSIKTPIYIDLNVEDQDINRPLQPGQPIDLKTDPNSDRPGNVLFPDTGNSLRPEMLAYAKWLMSSILAAAHSVEPDSADVTNRGAMTQAVLEQLYLPLVQSTMQKRKTWGEDGLEPFLALVSRCLQKIGVDLDVNPDKEETYEVSLGWSPLFELNQADRQLLVTRMITEVTAGFITQERAVEIISQAEGITDADALKVELENKIPANEGDNQEFN